VTRDEWLSAFAERLGVEPPSPEEIEGLLELAATAAHASERQAAPIACWLAARAGRDVAGALELARGVAPPRP
jgi:hypothetical protein